MDENNPAKNKLNLLKDLLSQMRFAFMGIAVDQLTEANAPAQRPAVGVFTGVMGGIALTHFGKKILNPVQNRQQFLNDLSNTIKPSLFMIMYCASQMGRMSKQEETNNSDLNNMLLFIFSVLASSLATMVVEKNINPAPK